jgi:hypothetical protein
LLLSVAVLLKPSGEFSGAMGIENRRKAPCHIWRPETAAEKKASMIEIQKINEAIEPELRKVWELTTGMRRLGIHRNRPGRKPQFRMTENVAAVSRPSSMNVRWHTANQPTRKWARKKDTTTGTGTTIASESP